MLSYKFPGSSLLSVPCQADNLHQILSLPPLFETMSSRQKSTQINKRAGSVPARSVPATSQEDELDNLPIQNTGVTSEWDYKLAITIITAIAFVTRFWGIGHPNEVVFDEVHFGKVEILAILVFSGLPRICNPQARC